jgi:hypothetical protein
MNKNRIEGRHGAMSWHHTAKSPGLPVEVNAAAVQGSNAFLPGEIPRRKCRGKSAEAIVAVQRAGGVNTPVETKKPEDSMRVKG